LKKEPKTDKCKEKKKEKKGKKRTKRKNRHEYTTRVNSKHGNG